ncbi:MAG: hypothetical protein ACLR6B_00740 [Blautia sp.]
MEKLEKVVDNPAAVVYYTHMSPMKLIELLKQFKQFITFESFKEDEKVVDKQNEAVIEYKSCRKRANEITRTLITEQ